MGSPPSGSIPLREIFSSIRYFPLDQIPQKVFNSRTIKSYLFVFISLFMVSGCGRECNRPGGAVFALPGMHPQDIRTLKMLEAIEAEPARSQRDLARQLGVSLGLVNAFVKQLAKKGYFKVSRVPKSSARYILTPQGALEKTRLTCEYIQFSYNFYREARRKLRQVLATLASQGTRHIVFYGTGNVAEMAFICLQEVPLRLQAVVCDGDCPEKFLGYEVQRPEHLQWASVEKVLITGTMPVEEALERLLGLGLARERIVSL
jgi:DNA-binding MarR family transcriptional regulator